MRKSVLFEGAGSNVGEPGTEALGPCTASGCTVPQPRSSMINPVYVNYQHNGMGDMRYAIFVRRQPRLRVVRRHCMRKRTKT